MIAVKAPLTAICDGCRQAFVIAGEGARKVHRRMVRVNNVAYPCERIFCSVDCERRYFEGA